MNNISVNELKSMTNINIIDIRRREKYNRGHIKGAISIPKEEFVNYLSSFSKNKNYYIYCDSGVRSLKLVKQLNSLGYNFTNIEGGYNNYLLRK